MSKKDLIGLIVNYLNYVCFSAKFAKNTGLNYFSDLNQAFYPLLGGQFTANQEIHQVIFQDFEDLKTEKTSSTFYSASQQLCLINRSNFPISVTEFLDLAYENSKPRLSELSPASRRRKLSTLKNFSQWCLDQKLIERDRLRLAPSSKIPERLPEYLNLDEILIYFKSLLLDFTQEPHKYRNELLNFLVLYGCGLRTEEACHIKIKDIDFKQSRILILGKGNKERFAILPEFVKLKLEELIDPKATYLYGEKPLVARTAYNWIKKRGLKAGLHKPVHPHMFRHTYATHMLRGQTDLRHLQELLGHRSLLATQRYTHLDKDQLRQSLESFHPLSK